MEHGNNSAGYSIVKKATHYVRSTDVMYVQQIRHVSHIGFRFYVFCQVHLPCRN